MKGNSKLVISNAEMLEAMQYYLKENIFVTDLKFKVTSVKESEPRMAGMVGGFEIEMSDTEQ